MALEDILKKIEEDARAEGDALVSLGRAEAESIRQKARKEAEQLRAELMQKAKERAKSHADRIQVLAGLDQRKEVLREKKKLVDDAFAKAKESIRKFPPNQYLAFLRPLILKEVETGNEEIIVSSEQRYLFTQEFLKSLNDELGREKGHFRLSGETGNFSGGFILRERNRETNLTLETLIESNRDVLEPQVARLLFGQNTQHG
jgi:V/A-type H+-transporting ATPase subunit E